MEQKRKETAADRLFREGRELLDRGDPEGAYRKYEQAAGLGSTEAMLAIAGLYMNGFRPVQQSNLAEVLLKGGAVFPWDFRTGKQPDTKSAFEWTLKAADAGNPGACELAGLLLCEGTGCRPDPETGLKYLDTALENGIPSAQKWIWLYRPISCEMSDEEYESCLARFEKLAEAGDPEAFKLYAKLKSGTEKQLARLGYSLAAAKNLNREGFDPFRWSFRSGTERLKLPLVPAHYFRADWKTLIRFNLDAFPNRRPLIAVSSDILNPEHPRLLEKDLFHRARMAGRAVYRSPAFGWLPEEKKAVLIRLGEEPVLGSEELKKIGDSFYRAFPHAYLDEDSTSFIVEHGEKEYSLEIACIRGKKIDILCRYTIGGSERVERFFEPEPVSVTLDT